MKLLNLAVLLLPLAFGCVRPEVGSPDENADLKTTASPSSALLTVQKPTPMGDVVVTLLKVEDNRCPTDVKCVWYGYAAATLEVKKATGAHVTQQLYLGGPLPAPNDRGFREADTVNVLLGATPYRLILSEVQPYPKGSDQNPSEKKAAVSVSGL